MDNLILVLINLICVNGLPTVQRGLFVISGVSTCGDGSGYCLLGNDCTMNEDFMTDEQGHCKGLRTAFTPEAFFSCCRYRPIVKNSTFDLNDVTLPSTATFNNLETEIPESLIMGDEITGASHVKFDLARYGQLEVKNEEGDKIFEQRFGRTGLNTNQSNVCCPEESVKNTIKIGNATAALALDTTNEIDLNENTSTKFENPLGELIEDSALDEIQEFVGIRRASSDDHIKNERNCTRHDFSSRPVFAVPSTSALQEQRDTTVKEKFDKNRCLNLTSQSDDDQISKTCVNVWKFVSGNEVLCSGTLINSVWLLTSASCVTKIFHDGMDSVLVTNIGERSGYFGISNMIVHENYKTDEMDDMHNIGLVSLNQVVNTTCFACLPKEERKYADKSCLTYTIAADKRSQGRCQDRLKILSIHSKMYLSLSCTAEGQHPFMMDNWTANPLWCENTLVGIETSHNQGIFVFTPINEYADWIMKNLLQYL